MENENLSSVKRMFDVATVISLVGIFLYVLGILYLNKFYTVLRVPTSLLDLALDKVIIRTWPLIFAALLGFFPVYFQIFLKNIDQEKLPLAQTIIYLLLSIILMVCGIWAVGRQSSWTVSLLTILTVISITVLALYLEKKIKSEKTIDKLIYMFVMLAIFPVTCLGIYSFKGQSHGETMKTEYEEDIEITLNHDNQKIYGKWILFSNNKYIIIIENNNCDKETYIINNEEVNHIRFISTAVY